MRLRMAAKTEVGARAVNEDALRLGFNSNGYYAVLADGAGGHSRGADASTCVVDCFERILLDPGVGFSPANLTQMVRLAHRELLAMPGPQQHELRMHTTIVALWIDATAKHVLWTHVGDSRLYRVRQGQAEQLTQDDSVVQQMVMSGLLTQQQSRHHPQKNRLLAALGMEGEVEPHTVPRPVGLMKGDAFLLCSDGWWESFEPADIVKSLNRALTVQDWLDDMHRHVLAQAAPRQDNFSAVAVWAGDPGEVTVSRVDDTIPRALRLVR